MSATASAFYFNTQLSCVVVRVKIHFGFWLINIQQIRGVFQKFVAFDTRATDTQLKPTTFLYIVSLIRNAHIPVVLQVLNY